MQEKEREERNWRRVIRSPVAVGENFGCKVLEDIDELQFLQKKRKRLPKKGANKKWQTLMKERVKADSYAKII